MEYDCTYTINIMFACYTSMCLHTYTRYIAFTLNELYATFANTLPFSSFFLALPQLGIFKSILSSTSWNTSVYCLKLFLTTLVCVNSQDNVFICWHWFRWLISATLVKTNTYMGHWVSQSSALPPPPPPRTHTQREHTSWKEQ